MIISILGYTFILFVVLVVNPIIYCIIMETHRKNRFTMIYKTVHPSLNGNIAVKAQVLPVILFLLELQYVIVMDGCTLVKLKKRSVFKNPVNPTETTLRLLEGQHAFYAWCLVILTVMLGLYIGYVKRSFRRGSRKWIRQCCVAVKIVAIQQIQSFNLEIECFG